MEKNILNLELISVIIPTYKNRGGLKKAVESTLKQTYYNIEVIVVDDNDAHSLERLQTETLMKQFENFSQVIYLKHPYNKNGATARNTGIENSKGEIVCFLDDDDTFLPEKLEKQFNYLITSKYDAVYCGFFVHGKKQLCYYEGSLSKELLLLKAKLHTCSLMFYKRTLIQVGGFDESYKRHQDYELLLKFFRAGFTIGCVPEYLFKVGTNKGENKLKGKQFETLKLKFFTDFKEVILELSNKDRRFKRRLYAIHFFPVFISYLKMKEFNNSHRIFKKYLRSSPSIFIKSFIAKAIASISIKVKNQ